MGVELHHPVAHDLNRDPAEPGCRGAGCPLIDRGQGQKAPRLRAVLGRAGDRAQRMGIKVCPERNWHGEPPSFATLNQTCLKPTRPNRVTPSGTWYEACFLPARDRIHMPAFEAFENPAAYYSVLYHEATHATAAAHRVGRARSGRFGSEAYAVEEIVADAGACMVLADLGIAAQPRPDHAAYIASWLKVLKNDTAAIFTAASKAQAAVDWMHAQQPSPMAIAA